MNKWEYTALMLAIFGSVVVAFMAGGRAERQQDRLATVDSFHEGMPVEMECLTSDVYFFPKKGVHQTDSDNAAHEFMRREGCLWINE